MRGIPLAWLQLIREKRRFAVALGGITFAVALMLMQLGLRDALYKSATSLYDHIRCDLVLTGAEYEYVFATDSFTRRRLYSALAVDGVESVAPLYLAGGIWKDPDTRQKRRLQVLGISPSSEVFDFPSVVAQAGSLRTLDVALFDSASRPEFGPIARLFRNNNSVVTELNGRRIEVVGLFGLGPDFTYGGHLITSDSTFLRLFPNRQQGVIDLGLIRVRAGADPRRVQAQLAAILPEDTKVFTRAEFIEWEKDYWARHLPIGFIFNLGSVLGLVVGAVIVYQILYTDVTDHLREYATLKAMGYRDRHLFLVVLQEAAILSVFGFLPGYVIAQALYRIAEHKALIPVEMTAGRVVIVAVLTFFMCGLSGAIAMRKLKTADPAEIF
jgi:putative ABC transport system permease protein